MKQWFLDILSRLGVRAAAPRQTRPATIVLTDPTVRAVTLVRRHDTLSILPQETADFTLPSPLVRVLIQGVSGGATGPDGIRLPESGLHVRWHPDMTVDVRGRFGWTPCPMPTDPAPAGPPVQPTLAPHPATTTVKLRRFGDTLAIYAAEYSDQPMPPPLVRILIDGVPGGLTGPEGVRLPEAGLHVRYSPGVTVEVRGIHGWGVCPMPEPGRA